MKPLVWSLLLALGFTLRGEPPRSKAASVPVLFVGQRTFLDAAVSKLDAFTARITHSTGAATVPAWEMSAAQQKSFGFDPAATAAERARREVAIRAAQAEADDRERLAAEQQRVQLEEKQKAKAESERIEFEQKEAAVLLKDKENARILADTARRKKAWFEGYNRYLASGVDYFGNLSRGGQLQLSGLIKRLNEHGQITQAELMMYSPETQSIIRRLPGALEDPENPLSNATLEERLVIAILQGKLRKTGPFTGDGWRGLAPEVRRIARQFVPEVLPR